MAPRPNSGAISKNLKKEQDKHPDMKGDCMVDGREYWVSAWLKEGKDRDGNPRKFFSLAFTPKDEQKARAGSGGGSRPSQQRLNDDIPY